MRKAGAALLPRPLKKGPRQVLLPRRLRVLEVVQALQDGLRGAALPRKPRGRHFGAREERAATSIRYVAGAAWPPRE